MAIQLSQDAGGPAKPTKRTKNYYGGSSYGTGDQAGATKRPSYKLKYKPAKTPKPGKVGTTDYYGGSSYGTGPQAGFHGTKKDKPKKDKPKRDPNRVTEYWGRGDSGYGSGANRGTGGSHKAAAERRTSAKQQGHDRFTNVGTNKKENLSYSKGNYAERRKAILGSSNKNASGGVGNKLTKANEDAYFNYREQRQRKGDYKGKYYGPDAFKGNIKKLAAWRAAGSPKDKSRFA